MRVLVLLLIAISFIPTTTTAQVIDNRIFKMIRNERYDAALQYGNKKINSFTDSIKYYKKAIPYHLGMGMVYRKLGEFSDAEKHYAEAKRILKYKEQNHKRKKIIDYDVFDELAQMYIDIGNFYGAEDLIKEGIKARSKRFDPTNLLRYRSYLVYGNYFFQVGAFDSAIAYYSRYIYYIKNSRHTSKEELNRYADTYKQLTELEIQQKDITQALLFAKKNKHLQFHSWTKKEAGKNNLNKIASLNLLSECYRILGDTKNAEKYNRKAFDHYNLVIKEETFDKVPLLMNRGYIKWNKKDYSGAEEDFIYASKISSQFVDRNFKSLSEYEKENFYASVKGNFEILNSFALSKYLNQKNDHDTLWSFIYNFQIKTKAIILNESNRMLETIQTSQDPQLIREYQDWRKLKNQLANKMIVDGLNENDPSIKEMRVAINNLEKAMAEKSFLFKEKEKSPTWLAVQKKLKADEAVVEVIRVRNYGVVELNNSKIKSFKKYSSRAELVGDSISYLFLIINPHSLLPEPVFIQNGNLLEGKNYKQYINAQLYNIGDKYSYSNFWKPLQTKLQGFKSIYFSADGIYNLINLWVLKNPETNRFLIDEVNIINVTNSKQLLSFQQGKVDFQSVILIGRPNYSKTDTSNSNTSKPRNETDRGIINQFRGGLNDLPGTQEEVSKIGTYLSEKNIQNKIYLWDQATEGTLKDASSPNVLHIATHGYFNADGTGSNPMLKSGLLFAGVINGHAGSSHDDGILTAYEASNLDLAKTHLVVLSACETGLGEVKNGEGVYGLQRAFEVAGVDDILMSMWKVNDETTQELMVAFYKELIKGQSVLEAFKMAQLSIRSNYPSPLYWGAFKLIGR
jgi:CHAT domain-containing protein